jgi:hypothetical protein
VYQNDILDAMIPYISNWEQVSFPLYFVPFLSLLVADPIQPTVKFGMKVITPN